MKLLDFNNKTGITVQLVDPEIVLNPLERNICFLLITI